MTESNDSHQLRVERGAASPEELAALIAVLLSRTAAEADPPAAAEPVPTARWRRPERVYLFDAPRVWRAYDRVGG
ncbi:acyl-CoA carboxylase subunit epsilon [Streptomyces sp. NBC_01476]|uniref:acyl-CoA carboxylase subunit epsilon n=1 Tax=Streptomyces sp. NBC_01476 TaxID=2903881 RepID=UPI002E34EC0D|nr:acyl-CoA carboxylase subunit epsilon [Streptomyces sp. NBC_01476]